MKSYQTITTPAKSNFINALSYAGNIIALTYALNFTEGYTEMGTTLKETTDKALKAFFNLSKIRLQHNKSDSLFKIDATKALKKVDDTTTDLTSKAVISLFNYRNKIKNQELQKKLDTCGGSLPKEKFIDTIKALSNQYLFTKRYFFYPFRYKDIVINQNQITIPFTTDTKLNIEIKDDFYSLMLKEYAKTPEVCMLYIDTKLNSLMTTFIYYTNEKGFSTLQEVYDKYGKGDKSSSHSVDNLNVFWYIKGKTIGL